LPTHPHQDRCFKEKKERNMEVGKHREKKGRGEKGMSG
jgi:hypothetical protein